MHIHAFVVIPQLLCFLYKILFFVKNCTFSFSTGLSANSQYVFSVQSAFCCSKSCSGPISSPYIVVTFNGFCGLFSFALNGFSSLQTFITLFSMLISLWLLPLLPCITQRRQTKQTCHLAFSVWRPATSSVSNHPSHSNIINHTWYYITVQ